MDYNSVSEAFKRGRKNRVDSTYNLYCVQEASWRNLRARLKKKHKANLERKKEESAKEESANSTTETKQDEDNTDP